MRWALQELKPYKTYELFLLQEQGQKNQKMAYASLQLSLKHVQNLANVKLHKVNGPNQNAHFKRVWTLTSLKIITKDFC